MKRCRFDVAIKPQSLSRSSGFRGASLSLSLTSMAASFRWILQLHKDVPRAARFYSEGLDFTINVCTLRWAELQSGPLKLALMQNQRFLLFLSISLVTHFINKSKLHVPRLVFIIYALFLFDKLSQTTTLISFSLLTIEELLFFELPNWLVFILGS